jgi:hypothetical protein
MEYSDSIDAVVQDCRFVLAARDLDELIPQALAAIPPLATIEYLDSPRESAVLGYAVRHSADMLGDLVRLVLGQLGKALADPDYQEPVDSLTAAQLRSDPWCQRLTELLSRAVAHGGRARLDSVLWLVIADVVAGLLNHHEPTLALVRTLLPDEAKKGEKYIQDLLRQKGTSTARHAATKNKVLRSLLARNDFAMSSVSEVLGEAYVNPLWREMVANRLVFSEKPGGLHSFFDLREVFAVRPWRIDADDFADLQRVVRAVIEEAYRRAGSGRATAAESWLVSRFASDSVLEKAGRLDVADATSSMSFDGEDFSSRVAWLLSLQPQVVEYVVAHLDVLGAAKLVARRDDIRKEFRARLKNPASLAPLVPGFQEVQRAVLAWDFLSAVRSRLVPIDADETGRLMHGERQLRSRATPLDLTSAGRLRNPVRHGTVVAVELGSFASKVAEQILGDGDTPAPDPDFASLCLRQLMGIRRNLGVFRGRAESFAGGVVTDVFPRALDALRYVTLFQAAVERTQLLRTAPWKEPKANPFAQGLRAGLGTGAFVDLALPGRSDGEGVASRWYAAGPLLDAVHELASARGRMSAESVSSSQLIQAQLSGVHDPLQVYRVHTAGGRLDNRGLVSFAKTFREIAAAVRLEGLPTWTPERGGDLIAGRRVQLKNYRFEMIFDDPATGRIVLVREVENPPTLPSAPPEGEGLYEYVVMWPDGFQTFIDRVMELERHQPVMARRPSRELERPSRAEAPGTSSPPASPMPQPPRAPTAPRARTGAPAATDAPSPGLAMSGGGDFGELNLPAEADFQFGGLGGVSQDLEAQLGLSIADDGLNAFGAGTQDQALDGGFGWDVSGDLSLPAPDDAGPDPGLAHAPDLGLLDTFGGSVPSSPALPGLPPVGMASDEIVAGFRFDETGEHGAPAQSALERYESGGLPSQALQESQESLAPISAVPGPTTGYDLKAAPGGHGDYDLDRMSAAVPSPALPPRAVASPSLLGRVEADVVERILELEGRSRRPLHRSSQEVQAPPPSAETAPPPPPTRASPASEASMPSLQRAWATQPAETGPAPERLSVPRPDFHVLFRDYVTFWVGDDGAEDAWIAVGRRYRDVFFDLHRFDRPAGAADWGVDDALQAFLRGKIRENFVPQSLSYEELPAGASERTPIDVGQLERAFAAIT